MEFKTRPLKRRHGEVKLFWTGVEVSLSLPEPALGLLWLRIPGAETWREIPQRSFTQWRSPRAVASTELPFVFCTLRAMFSCTLSPGSKEFVIWATESWNFTRYVLINWAIEFFITCIFLWMPSQTQALDDLPSFFFWYLRFPCLSQHLRDFVKDFFLTSKAPGMLIKNCFEAAKFKQFCGFHLNQLFVVSNVDTVSLCQKAYIFIGYFLDNYCVDVRRSALNWV